MIMILDQSHFFLGSYFGFGDALIWKISAWLKFDCI